MSRPFNPFARRMTGAEAWVFPVTVMCMVLGAMLAFAWVQPNSRSTRAGFVSPDQRERINRGLVDVEEFQQLSEEVKRLRSEKTELENALAGQSGQAKLLNESLQESKQFAGLTDLQGPGVVVTLRDSPKADQGAPVTGSDAIIHDADVSRVVNELFASGAEAISVNNRRVTSISSFRCVGPVIHFDAIPIATPIVIRAIGDTDTLMGGMSLPLGVLSEIRDVDSTMVSLERAKLLKVPAYAGNTTMKWAKPVPPAKP